jgi:sporulation protein YlmC with PRC-barrel domain
VLDSTALGDVLDSSRTEHQCLTATLAEQSSKPIRAIVETHRAVGCGRETMVRDFTSADEGKRVMTADGKMVGTVDQVQGGKAHVTVDESLSQSIRRKLGWTKEGEASYELQQSKVDKISDDEIHLKRRL